MGKVSQHYMEEIERKYEREELLRPLNTEENAETKATTNRLTADIF
ncbi:hypothetical protein [Candidatus Liberibacter sp.]|nr:hypothetical protein [Candidatus Liberibacter sp.]MBA5724597.1 hypothetical protein [Candidatus Liberibacter sp.]